MSSWLDTETHCKILVPFTDSKRPLTARELQDILEDKNFYASSEKEEVIPDFLPNAAEVINEDESQEPRANSDNKENISTADHSSNDNIPLSNFVKEIQQKGRTPIALDRKKIVLFNNKVSSNDWDWDNNNNNKKKTDHRTITFANIQ